MALDAISTTGSLILNPLISLWNSFVGILPGIIAAIICTPKLLDSHFRIVWHGWIVC